MRCVRPTLQFAHANHRILSIYNAIGVSIMGLNLSWLAVTFVLGNCTFLAGTAKTGGILMFWSSVHLQRAPQVGVPFLVYQACVALTWPCRSVTERRPVAPIVLCVSPEPRSDVASSTGRASTATLAPDSNLWDDIIKAQTMYPVGPPAMTSVKVSYIS